MSVERINDLHDTRLQIYRDLPHSKEAQEEGRFVAEGMVLVDRMLDTNYKIESILLEERFLPRYEAIEERTRLFVTPNGAVESIIGFSFHRGVLASARRPDNVNYDQLLAAAKRGRSLVICISICDPVNLGGVIRNAAAFGAAGVIVDPTCADPYARRVMRVSMGTNLAVPIRQAEDITSDLQWLKQNQVQLLAATIGDSAIDLHSFTPRPAHALLLGNEGHGLAEEHIACADQQVSIPMQLGTDSLNVAVASGILLYALRNGE